MDRRHFLASSLAAGTALSTGLGTAGAAENTSSNTPFKLKYAPDIGRFRQHAGNDLIDGIRFMHDQGFRAIFDNGLMGKPADLQERIGNALRERNMDMGPFVIYADFGKESFVLNDADIRRDLINRVRSGIETAKRTGAKWGLMVPGRYNQRMDWGYQTANVIENLKYIAEVCEESGLVIVLEPLNKRDHPGLFLTTISQTYAICRAVNHPCCKIVNDLYHQQITEGNLIPNIDNAWGEIASFHVGDNPGRREPGTGEINYRNIFKHLHQKGYDGVICMEHGISAGGKEGEKVLIEAYRKADDF
ncbi:MAG TPA: xylose isomerase [Phycisphaerales bacterium]|nr:xylose isomerase [Phycisphaerales bacterium]